MTARASATKLTYSDFLGFPDDGRRHELIDGTHYVTPSPIIEHQRLSGRLFVALHSYLERHPIGEVFYAPCDVVLSDHDVVVPDLLVVLNDQREIVTERDFRGSPALVIEILSPGTRQRDQGLKRRVYDRHGVREYWVIDPPATTVAVYRRTATGLDSVGCLEGTRRAVLDSPLLPGFQLSLTVLFGGR